MKSIVLTLICCLLPLVMLSGQGQQAQKLLSEAIYQEEVNGDLDEAVRTYQLIISTYPDQRNAAAKALLHLGVCYEKLGSAQARQTYQDVIRKYSDQANEVTMARERISRLEAYTAELVREAGRHLKAGNELFKRWEYDSAIEEYEKAVSSGPNSSIALNARYCIGQARYRSGQYDKALATFTKLIEDNPNSTIAPVTELMVAQVKNAMENSENSGNIQLHQDENTIIDAETGITFTKVKILTGGSDIITGTNDLNISPNGNFLLSGNMVVPMDGTSPFELIDLDSNKLHVTRGTWSPDGTKAAFFSGDALCVVAVSPETGQATGLLKKIVKANLQYQSNPGWSPDGKKLTYYGPEGDLWTVGSEGNELRQITNSEKGEVGPAWSPDGKTIAFGYGRGNIGLYNIENEKIIELAETEYRCFPVWAPDEKWIVGDQFGKLHFYSMEGKSELAFSPPKETGSFFSWSKNGKNMLFFRTSYFYNSGLKIASADGGPSYEPVPLLTNWGTALWSDNNKLVGVIGEDENTDIVFRIVKLSGGNSRIIHLNDMPDGKPFPFSISPNFEQLLFSIRIDKKRQDLYVVPVSAEEACTTGPPVKIFTDFLGERPTTFSPDCNKVGLIYKGNIWIAFTDGSDPVQVTDLQEEVGWIRWTNDENVILFSTPEGGWNLLVNPGEDAKIVKLLDQDKKIECRHWNIEISPDNTRFAVLTDEYIKIIPINENGSPEVLDISSLKLTNCYDLIWSPDGSNLAFIGTKETDDYVLYPDGKSHIYKIPVNGGPPVRIAADDDDFKDFLSWSPDGKWIAYSPEKPVKVRPESTMWEADFNEIVEKSGK
jgi:Tol biopolymer transport system component/TolA-binding protein